MVIPLWSSITLFAELAVTAAIYVIIWHAYRIGVFWRWFAFAVLAYEALFDMSYMLSREAGEAGSVVYNPYTTALGAFHGIFSLLMFVALVAFFLRAAYRYRRGENYFRVHRRLTIAFAVAWGVSIASGIALFVMLYLV